MKSIKVLGKTYSITEFEGDEAEHDETAGKFSWQRGRIWIRKRLTADAKLDCFIHEILHILATDLDLNLDESGITRLAAGLAAILLENKIRNPFEEEQHEPGTVIKVDEKDLKNPWWYGYRNPNLVPPPTSTSSKEQDRPIKDRKGKRTRKSGYRADEHTGT